MVSVRLMRNNDLNPDRAIDHYAIKNELEKINLVPFLLLYSSASKNAKLSVLYKVLMNDQGVFERNNRTQEFMFLLFAIPTIISVISLMDIQGSYIFLDIRKQDLKTILDTTEIKDIRRTTRTFFDGFFEGKNSLTYDEYISKFNSNNYMWIFDTKGIRMEVERLNQTKK